MKKFFAAIGNPPYQEMQEGDNQTFAPPVYDKFLAEAYKIADKVEMIHPARFLFNAGKTPKAWNKQMLEDPHLKVLFHEQDSSKVFANTDIKGGVAVTYHDSTQDFGSIGVFTPYPELNSIKGKVVSYESFMTISDIVTSAYANHFAKAMHEEHLDASARLSKGHAYDLKSNVFEKLDDIFLEHKPNDNRAYAKVLGLMKGKRVYRFICCQYLDAHASISKYKVFMPAANGSGELGETLASPVVGKPMTCATETFITIGAFATEYEANSLLKYIKTKFARALLSILKVTQHVTPEKWKYVPLQDFTSTSDIDWSQSIAEIDQQLYKKYGLSDEEIQFIETHVKEMN